MIHTFFSNSVPAKSLSIFMWLLSSLILVIISAGLSEPVWAISTSEVEAVASINRISIIMNGIIRIAAIGAGVTIVWLGHNTMIRGIKGEFEFEGQFGKLKGSTPGLLFVLLGSLVIGWSLQTTASGGVRTEQDEHVVTSDTNKNKRISDEKPPFLNDKPVNGENKDAVSPSK